MRQIDDPYYAEILENMRRGRLTDDQREALQSRILGDNRINSKQWKDASFLVPRHDLRVQMNFDAAVEHARNAQQPIIFSCAEDSFKRVRQTGRARREYLSTSDSKNNPLAGIVPLSIGMKVSLTYNICTNDGLTNGSQGILRQIVCDSDSNSGHLPKYVVVELTDGSPGAYEGLPPNHVPVYPIKLTCTRQIWSNSAKKEQKFQRTQLPLTPAFAFTDYKCQGQTLGKAVVDLAAEGTSAGVYVMLSRVQRLEDLLILRPFKESLLDLRVPPALQVEFKRFDECAKRTSRLKRWPDDVIAVACRCWNFFSFSFSLLFLKKDQNRTFERIKRKISIEDGRYKHLLMVTP